MAPPRVSKNFHGLIADAAVYHHPQIQKLIRPGWGRGSVDLTFGLKLRSLLPPVFFALPSLDMNRDA